MQDRTIAPLKNVGLFMELVDRVMRRPPHLPGMATFHGFSGYGKTFSATLAANTYRALYVEVGSTWTKASFLDALLAELGHPVRGTLADKVKAVITDLAQTDRPLIIDEFDHVATRGFVDLVREIHDKSGVATVLIGEELLPSKLVKWERFHGRMLDWCPAVPADLDDVRHLARLYAPGVEVADDLLAKITEAAQGRVRRACVSIERVREMAATAGLDTVDLKTWGDRPLFLGQPPARRQ
jgi:hypothetical protein